MTVASYAISFGWRRIAKAACGHPITPADSSGGCVTHRPASVLHGPGARGVPLLGGAYFSLGPAPRATVTPRCLHFSDQRAVDGVEAVALGHQLLDDRDLLLHTQRSRRIQRSLLGSGPATLRTRVSNSNADRGLVTSESPSGRS